MNAAQNAYDNRSDARLEVPFDAAFDDFPPTEENKTYLVEQFVTYHNAVAFEDFNCLQWLSKQIGFDADHWATEFVADELEELLK
jgi:hypothetical protein